MVTKSKSFNAVFCVPLLKLSINGLLATLSMADFLFSSSHHPKDFPLCVPVNRQL